jgi:hypothetical protein
MQQLNKDPTEKYQNQILWVNQKCDSLIFKIQHKYEYLLQIKPNTPELNALNTIYIKLIIQLKQKLTVSKHHHLNWLDSSINNSIINYLDILIHKGPHNLLNSVCREPTQTDTTIHLTSTHPLRRSLAEYHFYVNRIISFQIINHAHFHELNMIRNIARNNGFSIQLIHNLCSKHINKRTARTINNNNNNKTWATFNIQGCTNKQLV